MKFSLVIIQHKFSTHLWFGTEINPVHVFLRIAYGVNMPFMILQTWALQNELGNGLYLNFKRTHDKMILTRAYSVLCHLEEKYESVPEFLW